MIPQKFNRQFAQFYEIAIQIAETVEADALLIVLDGPTDWQKLKAPTTRIKLLVSADHVDKLAGASEAGLATVVVNMPDAPVFEKLTQALLEAVADDILVPGAAVIAVYS
jgi:hypothetical protein